MLSTQVSLLEHAAGKKGGVGKERNMKNTQCRCYGTTDLNLLFFLLSSASFPITPIASAAFS